MSGRAFERLPTTVVPTNYDILWKPDLVKCTFTGTETVNVTVSTQCYTTGIIDFFTPLKN